MMDGKVTAIRIDRRGERASLRALSKTGQGTQFTLRSVKLDGVPFGLPLGREALRKAIDQVLSASA